MSVKIDGDIGVIPVGNASGVAFNNAYSGSTIAATNVQAAIQELDTEKASLASPAFTGNPTAPTPTAGDNDTSIATTAFVVTAIAGKANLASPALTGNPTAPTPATADNDTSIATTAHVQANAALKVSKSGDTMTGKLTVPEFQSDGGAIISGQLAIRAPDLGRPLSLQNSTAGNAVRFAVDWSADNAYLSNPNGGMRLSCASDLWSASLHIFDAGLKWRVPGGAEWSTYIDAGQNLVFTRVGVALSGAFLPGTGGNWTVNSDERIKENLSPIENGLEKVNSIRALTGNFIGNDKRMPFLIAQDVQKVLPEAVDTSREYLGLDYNGVTPLLVAAIKELSTKLDTALTRITELESKQ